MANKINPFLVDKSKETTSIQFIIRKNGERYRYTPGISIRTEHWIDSQRWCREGKKYPDGFLKNEQIKKYINIIDSVFIEFDKELITPTQQSFKKAVDSKIAQINEGAGGVVKDDSLLTNYISNYIQTCDKTTGTYRNYQNLLNHLVAYEQETGYKLRFSNINMDFYNGFRTHMLTKTYTIKDQQRHYSKNYIGGLFKMITKFMNESAGELHNNTAYIDKRFKKEKEETDSIYLTKKEVQKIFDLNITAEMVQTFFKNVRPSGITRKVKALNDARLIFLVGCYTGLRISDYSRIEDFNIDKELIKIRTQKTNKIVSIPIHKNFRTLLNKTNVMSIKMSDQRLNDHIKELGLIAGITDEVKISKTEGGVINTYTYNKNECISTHTARRSFATNLYFSGADIFVIKDLLGHSKIETTIKYLKVSIEENARRIADNSFFKGE